MTISLLFLATAILTNMADISSALAKDDFGRSFSIVGIVTFPSKGESSEFLLIDKTGHDIAIRDFTGIPVGSVLAGDTVLVSGILAKNPYGLPYARGTSLNILSHGTAPETLEVSAGELLSGKFRGRPVRIRGTVREVFKDEIDTKFVYVVLACGDETVYAAIAGYSLIDVLRPLTGSEITATGVCTDIGDGLRRMTGYLVLVSSANGFSRIGQSPAKSFSSPLIDSSAQYSPKEIATMGIRRIIGRVLASWGDGRCLAVDGRGKVSNIRFADPPYPRYGDTIEAEGFPETDLFRINLSAANWRPNSQLIKAENPPEEVPVARLFRGEEGRQRFNPVFHGRTLRIVGTVLDMPAYGQDIITLKCDDFILPVDVTASREVCASLSVGCKVSVCGTCVVETDSWRPYAAFPHATGILLVTRTPDDITILATPPWWTPARLTIALGVLLLMMTAIIIWNRSLQRVVDRKSRQLLKEQVAQIKTALRVDERTNLAVELHDSLSQNLSGVACQIAATKGTLPEGASETARYLATAERMLLSCRTELRRCLWDLRGDALEETDFTEAIRKTLAPVVIGVETIIRFNVPRSRLSDTTAHAVLCIIRELAANAIRHGKARILRIAGEFHDGRLSFSVRDNGLGFDPLRCDGPAEGHFGLEGIRERIKRLNGTFTLSAEPGKGTRAEVSIMSIPSQCDDTNS